MNDRKIQKLFAAARRETPPAPPEDFDAQVLRLVRREQRAAPVTLWDQLGELFPRLAVASILVLGLCVCVDFYYSARHPSGLKVDLAELSEQWQQADNGD